MPQTAKSKSYALTLLFIFLFSLGQSPAQARHHSAALIHKSRSASIRHHKHKRSQAKVSISKNQKKVCSPRLQAQIGALVISESGQTVMDNLSSQEFNPASVCKLITAFAAIKSFGLEHRFESKLYACGKLNKKTGILEGDLYLQGSDPEFCKEDAVALKSALKEAGVRRVNGLLYVSRSFSYASSPDPNWSARYLSRMLGGKLNRSNSSAYSLYITKGTALKDELPENAELLYEHQSESLKDTLKDMLSYSRNNVAEQIARVTGGLAKVKSIASQEAGIADDALKLASGSGLGRSRVSAKDMMAVLKSLRAVLQEQNLDLQDICPVAGVDRGTLDERFKAASERGSVVAKTGSLPGTDGGTSTLCGMFRTLNQDFYFVIFCWRGSVPAFRQLQDNMIRKIQMANGGARPYQYGGLEARAQLPAAKIELPAASTSPLLPAAESPQKPQD